MQSFPGQARPCFICGSSAGPHLQSHRIDVLGIGRVDYAIRCCDGCGLVRQDPVVAPAAIGRQYALFSNYLEAAPPPFGAEGPVLNQAARRLIGQVDRLQLEPGIAFDAGAATGRMLWHLRKRGWRVTGCEPSPAAVEQARTLYDVELLAAFEEDALPQMRDLDCVLFSHVLEHIYDPAATLRRVAAALKPDGVVLFEVPSLEAKMGPGVFMMEHLTYFTPQSAANLLHRCGFEPLLIERDEIPAYPVITVAARRAAVSSAIVADQDGRREAEAYVQHDARLWQAVDARLAERLPQGARVAVWGAGLHTSMLLERTALATRNRLALLTDRDAQKHGHVLGAYEVVPPVRAIASDLQIVISSFHSEAQIAADLLAQGVPETRVVRLYT